MRRRNPKAKRRRPLTLDSGVPIIQSLIDDIAGQPVTNDAAAMKDTARLLSLVATMLKLEAQFGPRKPPPKRTRRNLRPRAPVCARTTSAFS